MQIAALRADRANPRRRIPHHAEPESDRRQYADRKRRRSRFTGCAKEAGLLAPWSGLRRNAMACVALPTCGLALAESERYLPDLIAGAGRAACRARAFRRRHRHPHDRLPEWLRAALSRGDRLGRQRAGPLQPLPRRRLRRLAAQKLYREDLDHAGIVAALDPVFAAYARRAKRENDSAISPSAPVSSRRRTTAAIFTPIQGRNAQHEQ